MQIQAVLQLLDEAELLVRWASVSHPNVQKYTKAADAFWQACRILARENELARPVTNSWQSAHIYPPLVLSEYGWLSSAPVLVLIAGDIRIATFEQIDEEDEPTWYSYDSERWILKNISHWMPLPAKPAL